MLRPDQTQKTLSGSRIDWHWIARSLLQRKQSLATLVAVSLISYISFAVIPIAIQKAIDLTLGNQASIAFIASLVAIVGFLYLTEPQCQYLSEKTIQDVGVFIEMRLSKKLLLLLLQRPFNFGADGDGEALLVFQQCQKIRDFAFRLAPRFVLDIGQVLISAAVLASFDLMIASIVVFISLSVSMMLRRLLSKYEALDRDLFDAETERQSNLSETVSGLLTIQAQALEALRFRSFEKTRRGSMDAELALGSMSRRFGRAMSLVSGMVTTVLLAIGCYKLAIGSLTIGELIAIQLLTSRIVNPILLSGDIVAKFAEVRTAMNAIQAFAAAAEPAGRTQLERRLTTSPVKLEDVEIAYEGKDQPAIRNITLDLPDKGVVAFVGRNGSGKTTLLRALLGLIPVRRGTISFGAKPLQTLHPRSLRRSIGVVEQDTVLFRGSLGENIAKSATFDAATLSLVADQAGISAFGGVPSHPVSEGGLNFSGGQRQRIAYARALYSGADLLVFDEPTSFIDAEAARAFENEILKLGRSKLLLMVTHDMGIAAQAELIVVLEAGQIVGLGSHDDLLKNCTTYQMLQQAFRGLSH